jgi:sugar phosphate permease
MTAADTPSAAGLRSLLRYRWAVYGIQLACIALVTYQFVVPATIGEQLAELWELEAAALGVLGAGFFYVYGLMQIPSGLITDTWGPRRAISLAMVLMGLGQIVFALAPSFPVAVLGRSLTGLGGALVLIALLKTLVIWFRAREFATLMGTVNVAAFGGAMLATAPLAYVSLRWGWRLPLGSLGGLALLLAALNWALARDDPRQLGLPTISEIDPDSATSADDAGGRPGAAGGLTAWARTPSWLISVGVLMGFGSFSAFQALWAGPYLSQVHGRSPVAMGTTLLLLSVGAGLGPFAVGYLSDRAKLGRRPLLIAGAAGIALIWLAILATTYRPGTVAIDVSFLLLGFFAGALLIGQTMIKEFVPARLFGVVFGIYNMLLFLANGMFQLSMGWLLDSASADPAGSYRLAFVLPVAASLLGLCLLLFVPESRPGRPARG